MIQDSKVVEGKIGMGVKDGERENGTGQGEAPAVGDKYVDKKKSGWIRWRDGVARALAVV